MCAHVKDPAKDLALQVLQTMNRMRLWHVSESAWKERHPVGQNRHQPSLEHGKGPLHVVDDAYACIDVLVVSGRGRELPIKPWQHDNIGSR